MRMPAAHDGRTRTPTNVSVRADLVRKARDLQLNLSALLERAVEQAIHDHERASWLKENSDAVSDYNARVERDGVFSDAWRRF